MQEMGICNMNDEIKEKIPFNVRDVLEDINSNILWNYITNLQQKYEEADYDRHKLFEEKVRLKELNAELKTITKRPTPIDYAMIQKRYEDYKSRCEKAIEYLQENYNELTDYGYKKEIYDDLLNILQNGSDNNV